MTFAGIKHVVAQCTFPGMTIKVGKTRGVVIFVQGVYDEADTVTGVVEKQYTRRWHLSPAMSASEIVQTVFKMCLTSMEHRTREWFKYRDRACLQPHLDIDKLWHLACRPVKRIVKANRKLKGIDK